MVLIGISLGNHFPYVETESMEAFNEDEWLYKEWGYNSDSVLRSFVYEFTSTFQNKQIFIFWDHYPEYQNVTLEYKEFDKEKSVYKKLVISMEKDIFYKLPNENGLAQNIRSRNPLTSTRATEQSYVAYDTIVRTITIGQLTISEYGETLMNIVNYDALELPFEDLFKEVLGKTNYEDKFILSVIEPIEQFLKTNIPPSVSSSEAILENQAPFFKAAPIMLYSINDKRRPSYLKKNADKLTCLEKEKVYERWSYGLKGDISPMVIYEVFR